MISLRDALPGSGQYGHQSLRRGRPPGRSLRDRLPGSEWHARKHGGAKRRVWRKMHLAIDEGEEEQERPRWGVSPTNMEVRAVEVTDSPVGDAPMLPCLLSQIPEGETIASVAADGSYDGRACRDAIATRGIQAFGYSLEPVAFVSSLPPRRNAKPWMKDSPGARARNEALRAMKRFGRMIWRKWSGYHRRTPSPHRHPGPLYRSRHSRHEARRLTSDGGEVVSRLMV